MQMSSILSLIGNKIIKYARFKAISGLNIYNQKYL